jgi:uncharacterized protein (TIGR03435 family)
MRCLQNLAAFHDPLGARPGREKLSSVFGPSGMYAVEGQLGLKMEATRSPIEVVVIDHIERTPTENRHEQSNLTWT